MKLAKDSRWIIGFSVVLLLSVAQVAWWTTMFMRDGEEIASLKLENALLQKKGEGILSPDITHSIMRESSRRRVMFLSESVSFVLFSFLGLTLLLISIRSERRSWRAMRNFMETISHDSKTPLTALKLRLESLLEGASNPQPLQLAMDEVRRLISIHERAANLDRLERSLLQMESVDLGEMVDEVLRRLEPFLKVRGVKLTCHVARELSVKGDLYSLQSSLQSLVENAVLYNDKESKEVSVSLRSEKSIVVLEVSDNGPGIRKEDLPKIFDRFYRGSNPKPVPGTGLGLYLVKKIIEAHRGEVRPIAAGIGGVGSCFCITLPVLA